AAHGHQKQLTELIAVALLLFPGDLRPAAVIIAGRHGQQAVRQSVPRTHPPTRLLLLLRKARRRPVEGVRGEEEGSGAAARGPNHQNQALLFDVLREGGAGPCERRQNIKTKV
ncbi:MAG: hypothetical protein NWR67_13960, partial [Saprospiraceae bacterium]|nr:hypothetical protein [Saprospiraceae bacterium]